MSNDFEVLKYRLINLLRATLKHIKICPDCRYYDEKIDELHHRVLKARKISGLRKLLQPLTEISSVLSGCRHCEHLVETFYDLEHELESYFKEERPSVIAEEEQWLSLEELEHLIRTKYPFPISYSYKNMERVSEPQKINVLINIFDVAARYICYILLADVHLRYPDIKEDVPFQKMHRPDLGKRGIHGIVERIHVLIPRDNQFVRGLTDGFLKAQPEYQKLYHLRCRDRHGTYLFAGLSETEKVDLYKRHLGLLRRFLERLKILTEYRLAVAESPVEYEADTRSMIYKITICVGDDPDFSSPQNINIALQDLLPNNRVILINDLNSFEPDNVLQLYPFIVTWVDERSHRRDLLLYHHYNKDEGTFEFFRTFASNVQIAEQNDKELYNSLYRIILART